jgi:hypothetical protein
VGRAEVDLTVSGMLSSTGGAQTAERVFATTTTTKLVNSHGYRRNFYFKEDFSTEISKFAT